MSRQDVCFLLMMHNKFTVLSDDPIALGREKWSVVYGRGESCSLYTFDTEQLFSRLFAYVLTRLTRSTWVDLPGRCKDTVVVCARLGVRHPFLENLKILCLVV